MKKDTPGGHGPDPSMSAPACAWCERVRNAGSEYHAVLGEQITHGVCPECGKYVVKKTAPPIDKMTVGQALDALALEIRYKQLNCCYSRRRVEELHKRITALGADPADVVRILRAARGTSRPGTW